MTRHMKLVNLVNELSKLHIRYHAWCEERGFVHSYEVECRTVLQVCEDMLRASKEIRDIGGSLAETTLPRCALDSLQRHVDELRRTLTRMEGA